MILITSAAICSDGYAQRRGPGGPGRGFGDGNMQDWFNRYQQYRQQQRQEQQKRTKEEAEKKTQEKLNQHLAEGWQSLKAGALQAAVEAFTDALELKPETAEARLGIGLARSADGQFTAAQKHFDLAIKAELPKIEQPKPKPATRPGAAPNGNTPNGNGGNNGPGMNNGRDRNRFGGFGQQPGGFPGFGKSPEELAAEAAQAEAERIEASKAAFAKADAIRRLSQYNLAVLYTRQNLRPKAAVSLHNILSAQKPGQPIDEMVVNAQRSLVFGQLDDAGRKGLGMLQQINKTLTDVDKSLASVAYPGQERFGVAWVPVGAGSQLRQAGKAEPFVPELPFVLPDGSVLKGKKAGAAAMTTNTLLPDVARSVSGDLLASAGIKATDIAAANQPGASAGTTPVAGVTGRSDRPIDRPVLSRPGGAPADPATPAATSGAPAGDGMTPTPTAAVAAAPIEAAVTFRGAAFCVAPGVLITCARHVQGNATVTVTDTTDATVSAEVVAIDEAAGLALLRTSGNFKPMRLADAVKAGPVHVACFAKASLFNPDLEVLKGDLVAAAGKPPTLRMGTHPRSAGAPIFDEQGRVVAVVSATRDDPIGVLPTVSVDAVRKLVSEKLGDNALAAVSGGVDPEEAVGELRAVRKEVVPVAEPAQPVTP
jgi:tetratricopeptide (TPR) repeat protein